jgi:hypothetical protein
MDGPVVAAARRALEVADVNLVLPFVPAGAEDEIRAAYDRVRALRGLGPLVCETADLWFFETVVRLHRAGEGAAYTGLKPAGLPVGPVIPLAEAAIESGSSEQLADFLGTVLRTELTERLDAVQQLAAHRTRSLADERRYVQAMLGYQVYSHHLYQAMRASAHHNAGGHPSGGQP